MSHIACAMSGASPTMLRTSRAAPAVAPGVVRFFSFSPSFFPRLLAKISFLILQRENARVFLLHTFELESLECRRYIIYAVMGGKITEKASKAQTRGGARYEIEKKIKKRKTTTTKENKKTKREEAADYHLFFSNYYHHFFLFPLCSTSPSAPLLISFKQALPQRHRNAFAAARKRSSSSSSSLSSPLPSSSRSPRAASSVAASAVASADASAVDVAKKELGDGAGVELTVTVPPAAVEAAWNAALSKARKGTSVPGFRKGAKVRFISFFIYLFISEKIIKKKLTLFFYFGPKFKKTKKTISSRSRTGSSSTPSAAPQPPRPSQRSTSSARRFPRRSRRTPSRRCRGPSASPTTSTPSRRRSRSRAPSRTE